MRQNQTIGHPLETPTLHQIRSPHMQDFMPPFPFQFYPPYWNYPFYNYPYDTTEKLGLQACKHCRMVSTASVSTQTADDFFEDHQLVERLEQFKINNTLPTEKIQELANVKQQQNYNEVVDFKEMTSSPDPSNQTSEKKEKQIFFCKTAGHPMNGDLFQTMLSKYLTQPEEYESLVGKYLKDDQLISQVIKYFHEKLTTFKKSKQEMIKLIIRKTQRHYKIENNCKRDDRFKKFGGYKSMNTVYLEKLFSDPAFARSYNKVFDTFIEDFEKESQEKLSVFLDKIYSTNTLPDFKAAMKILDEKNRMPWPAYWVEKLKKVAWEIKNSYVNENILENAALKKRGGR